MNVVIAYLRLPLSALRIWTDIRETDYSCSEKWRFFRTLLSMRVKEIGGSRGGMVSQDILGFNVRAYDYSTLRFLVREIFLAKPYAFKSDTPTPRVIDCGANIGMAVLFIKYMYPGARITAFEPNPAAFELLKLNVESNGLKDVAIVNKAVSNTTEPISFFVPEDKGTLSASVRADRGGAREIHVQTERLSDWLGEEADLVKIDVEGAEWMILEDLKEHPLALQKIRKLIVEYHHRINNEPSRFSSFLRFFEEHGYEYNLIAEYRYPGEFQDVLAHFYR